MDKDWSWVWYIIGAIGIALLIISIVMGFVWDEWNWYSAIAIVASILLIIFAFLMYFIYERHLKIKISNGEPVDRDVFLDDNDDTEESVATEKISPYTSNK